MYNYTSNTEGSKPRQGYIQEVQNVETMGEQQKYQTIGDRLIRT